MAVDERRRLELADAVKRALGDDSGVTLMELLPPVGWADVATRHDVLVVRGDFDRLRGEFDGLRSEFDALRNEFKDFRRDVEVRLEQGFRQMVVTMMALVIAGFLVSTFAVVATALVS